jgi:hypothetical protein
MALKAAFDAYLLKAIEHEVLLREDLRKGSA